jgi:hypothetical protein
MPLRQITTYRFDDLRILNDNRPQRSDEFEFLRTQNALVSGIWEEMVQN